jgi:uncharacterized protein (TIGR00369 family)
MSENSYIELPNRSNGSCFGCSPSNPVGLHMKFKADADSIVSDLSIPPHLCGWSKFVHGGVITTILDEVMSWSAMYFLKCLVVTKNLEIKFLKPVLVEEQIKAIGRVKEKKNRHEVVMEGHLADKNGRECVVAEATFAILSPDIANRMGISREEIRNMIP